MFIRKRSILIFVLIYLIFGIAAFLFASQTLLFGYAPGNVALDMNRLPFILIWPIMFLFAGIGGASLVSIILKIVLSILVILALTKVISDRFASGKKKRK